MSQFYSAKRTTNLYTPDSAYPFKVSRSKIELFLNCPRCFYLDRRLGVGQPPGFPFNLNSAVDHLLKKEFDFHRAKGSKHPLMEHYGLDAIPFAHPQMDVWRENFTGAQYLHKPTHLMITGAIDDIWQNTNGELIIVDYKSTAKDGEVSLDAEWQKGYKNQMEIYQWLFRQNGFTVSKTGYFVYCNGRRDREAFDAKLEFSVKLIPYEGDDSWVESVLLKLKECLEGALPAYSKSCDFCQYRQAASTIEAGPSELPKKAPVQKTKTIKIASAGNTLF